MKSSNMHEMHIFRFIPRMHKVTSVPLRAIDTFDSVQYNNSVSGQHIPKAVQSGVKMDGFITS